MNKVEHLQIIYANRSNDEDNVRERIKDVKNKHFFLPSLEGTNSVYGLYAVYIQQDIKRAKLCFFRVSTVALYMSEKYGSRIMDAGIYPISYALLSDDKKIIQHYSTLKNPINHVNSIGFQLPNAIQHILQGNQEKLAENIRNLERFVKLPRYKAYASTVEVFRGFYNKDAEEIEAGLQELLKTHKKRNTDPLISRFMSLDTAGLCKLAWLQGYEIDLQDELVPQALMPVQPLDKYESYDFLI
ncbi:immunity 49 family protein [Mucilaginibacter terrae]|uniref:immunity 49 family protein n=1 Tax=Mucilaginibacter terrae TaxID=1955052 RepID=UPI0036429F42